MKIYDVLTKREVKLLKALINAQELLMAEIDDYSDIIHFLNDDDCIITNPFLDESGSYEVDPVEYYGESFLNSEFMNM